MILVCDNYDSFTYNLVQYLGELGAETFVFRNDELRPQDFCNLEQYVRGVVISPGPGKPEDAGISMDLVRYFAGRVPVLGICLGHQCIGRVFGGEIVPAKALFHGKTSEIRHDGKVLFENVSNPFTATRYHSLVIDRKKIPACLEVTAETEDGEVMGVRHRDFKIEGLQFHPESILTLEGKKIISNFLNMCAD
ncbi:MAG TPA: aminodeoxychorismate/anthranilate synthase component II [Peptococcaceae bacterium]|nr:MAG: Para-aminobenzoate/anthranilate synthase glutamine amidotransferase component II [Clostridia bacterium 41_269]HBT20505.1 aminodeoxychorismate/anthranilate synthase component II [Peptococcaceae bacterium]